ncbi:MAG: hypothetical protein FJ315_06865 [SAR202 cluster bacterium]|nr:hypothetical protein [SAR202 cluster bacterium]
MILSREVMQARFGQGDQVIALLAKIQEEVHYPFVRVLTDAAGPSFTVIGEIEAPDIGEWEHLMRAIFSDANFKRDFQRIAPLIVSGRRELFNVVDVDYVPYKADPKRVIVVRNVFQAKCGRGDDLVALFRDSFFRMSVLVPDLAPRLLTDASGPFFTVATEQEAPSIAAWQDWQRRMFSIPEFQGWFAKMVPLVDHGSREFYNVVNFEGVRKPAAGASTQRRTVKRRGRPER